LHSEVGWYGKVYHDENSLTRVSLVQNGELVGRRLARDASRLTTLPWHS
jgi:hypothetical protein